MASSSWRLTGGVAWNTIVFASAASYINNVIYSQALVRGDSMQPTLNPKGCSGEDRVAVSKLSLRLARGVRRGDVVLLRSPENPEQLLIKRLIALEGDWLTLPGRVEVEKIPAGRCWVEGDNLDASHDSFTAFGAIPLALIEGRVTAVIWPPSRWGSVPSRPPTARLLVRNMHALSEDWRSGGYEW